MNNRLFNELISNLKKALSFVQRSNLSSAEKALLKKLSGMTEIYSGQLTDVEAHLFMDLAKKGLVEYTPNIDAGLDIKVKA